MANENHFVGKVYDRFVRNLKLLLLPLFGITIVPVLAAAVDIYIGFANLALIMMVGSLVLGAAFAAKLLVQSRLITITLQIIRDLLNLTNRM